MRILLVLTFVLALSASFLLAQPATPAQTAGQQYKNVTVLKDLPVGQFIPTMRYIATALGVECEFCHMGTRAEETPNKATARKMMAMTMAINKGNFDGRQEVTCFTCHKGSHDPANNPVPTGQYSVDGVGSFWHPTGPLVGQRDEVMYQAYAAEQKKEQAERAGLPKAEQILANYVNALGGEAALRKMTSRIVTSTTELSVDVRGSVPTVFAQQVQYFKAPNLYMSTLKRFDGSQTAKGFDGTGAWSQGGNGTVTNLAASDLTRAKRDADFYESINLAKEYKTVAARGVEKVDGRDAYVVVGTPEGDNPERLYFDKQSGLLVRKTVFNTIAFGRYLIQTDYSDYRNAGGVKVPFLVSTLSVSPADTSVTHVEKVENNATIDDAKFVKPASKAPAPR